MRRERLKIMEKARAKRRRQKAREAEKTEKPATVAEVTASLTEKVADFAQEAVAQVSALMKSATEKVTGTPEKTVA